MKILDAAVLRNCRRVDKTIVIALLVLTVPAVTIVAEYDKLYLRFHLPSNVVVALLIALTCRIFVATTVVVDLPTFPGLRTLVATSVRAAAKIIPTLFSIVGTTVIDPSLGNNILRLQGSGETVGVAVLIASTCRIFVATTVVVEDLSTLVVVGI